MAQRLVCLCFLAGSGSRFPEEIERLHCKGEDRIWQELVLQK